MTYDYEYVRNGCASAFMIYAPLECRRNIFISGTGTRTRRDYALALEQITEVMFPEAAKIVLVEDNLPTHGDASLYETFPPEKARRIAAVLATSIADRVATTDEFRSQCALAANWRNDAKATTRWKFNTQDAREKMPSLYPSLQA